jgi:hypothetical protein
MHYWSNFYLLYDIDAGEGAPVPTYEQFIAAKGSGPCTPMDFNDLVTWMRNHEDVFIMVHVRGDAKKVIEDIVTTADYDDAILQRIIVGGLYGPDTFKEIREIYDFLFYIYMTGAENPTDIIAICQENNVTALSISADDYENTNWAEIAYDSDLLQCVHTVNDEKEAQELFKAGVNLIFTDFIDEINLR